MTTFFLVSILIFVNNTMMAIFLFLKNKERAIRILAMMAVCIAIWGLGGLMSSGQPASQYNRALFWWQVAFAGIILTPVFYTHFVIDFLGLRKRALIICAYLLAGVFLFFNWYGHSKLFLGTLEFMFGQFYWISWNSSRNIAYLIFYISFYWLLVTLATIYLFLYFRKAKGIRKDQLRYVLFGSIIGWIGAQANFLPVFGVRIYPHLNFLTAFYAPIVAYGVIHFRIVDIRTAVTRAIIFLAICVSIVCPFLIIPFFKSTPLWWFPIFLMGIFATTGPFLYNYLRQRAENILLKEQKRYQAALKELVRVMTHIRDLNILFKTIISNVYQAIKPEFAGLYVFSKDNNSYLLEYDYARKKYKQPGNISRNSRLVETLASQKKPLLVENIDSLGFPPETAAIPCFLENNLICFLLIGTKQKKTVYTQSDFLLFDILSSHISLAIENCTFWQEEKSRLDREEQIRRQRAMDHFSASLAHEIDNPVFAVTGIAEVVKMEIMESLKKCIPQESFNYLNDRMSRVTSDLSRVSRMIKSVREFSSQTKGEQAEIKFEEVAESFLSIIEPQFKYDGIIFEKQIEPDILIKANKIHLEEILINLATNAMHAVKNNKEKKVTLKVYRNSSKTFLIEFKDNGYGVSPELLEDIFLDFVTTKASSEGKGIGLGRVRKIAQNHNGKAWAHSKGNGEGATFFVELPIR